MSFINSCLFTLCYVEGGVSIQTVLGLIGSAFTVMAAVITALWKSDRGKSDKTEARLTNEIKESKEAFKHADEKILDLTEKVGILTGKTEAYTEVNEGLEKIGEIELLAKETLSLLKPNK